ncbi:hypothetical protein JTB14_003170 [Gonioctena quinquepunctata]|nr:hypothetical protein JTB14_003170 [Gonioctena quinquepunctata]
MRRVSLLTRNYYYRGINGTPFSLVIALPHKYGFTRVEPKVENDVKRLTLSGEKRPLVRYFTGNWTIHPDWHYCRYLDNRKHFDSPEDELLYFLQKMERSGWKWSKECDRKLICQIVSDAKLSNWFNENITTTTKEENGAELVKKIGIVVAFMATHSGFTRWQNFPQNIESPEHNPNFGMLHNKAIDEIWYKRAVEHHYVDPNNFIYSVPHYTGNSSHSFVTVSRAIFKEEGSRKAPVAVVGYQFYHSALHSLFTKITSSCGDMSCKRTCDSEELHCLVLDDNGYVIVSDDSRETGFFFGKIRSDIMSQLVEEGIYKATKMYDYQGLCAEPQDGSSPAPKLFTPIIHLSNLFNWLAATLVLLAKTALGNHHFESMSGAEHYPDTPFEVMDEHEYEHNHEHFEDSEIPLSDKEFVQKFAVIKTKPEPCDTQMSLYSLVHYSERNISNSGYNKSMVECSRPFIVQRVSGSNMILLVITKVCWEDKNMVVESPDPVEVDYNMTLACYRAAHNDFPRRHYMSCINKHANESEIKLCGGGSNISPAIVLIFASISYVLLV